MNVSIDTAKSFLKNEYDIIPLFETQPFPKEIEEKINNALEKDKEGLKTRILKYEGNNFSIPSESKLSKMLKEKYTIMVDTNTVMSSGFEKFLNKEADTLIKNNARIVLMYDIIKELEKLKKDKKIAHCAYKALELIKKYKNSGLIYIQHKNEFIKLIENDYFADLKFLINVLIARRKNEKILVLSADKRLTLDSLMMNDILSIKSEVSTKMARLDEQSGEMIMKKLVDENEKE